LELTDGMTLPASGRDWLVGQGWSPQTPLSRLTPVGATAMTSGAPAIGQLPRSEDWINATLTLGGSAAPAGGTALWLDAPCAGSLPNQAFAVLPTPIGPPPAAGQPATAAAISATTTCPITLTSTVPALSRSLGVALIDGEVFAYRKEPATPTSPAGLTLIARGLLGSERRDHGTWGERPWPVLELPLGPVWQLLDHGGGSTANALEKLLQEPLRASPYDSPTSESSWFFISTDGHSRSSTLPSSPATVLVIDHGTDTTYHGVQLAGPNHGARPAGATNPDAGAFICPPWLRSLYGSAMPATNTTAASPLLIGWYPRFASAMPRDGSTGLSEQHFRCRSYPWAGFPLRFARMRLPLLASNPVQLPISGSQTVIEIQRRAMAGALNGDDTVAGALRFRDSTRAGPGTGFSDWLARPPFDDITASRWLEDLIEADLDGLEIRASWHYRTVAHDLPALLAHMNTVPPHIARPVSITVVTPTVVVGTD
jgi:hypothetical protein